MIDVNKVEINDDEMYDSNVYEDDSVPSNNKKRIYEIIQEAVEIEKEFICESIPCRLIGMNSTLMAQYIEFCADRLSLQLGYEKIYNSANPFDFMELISVETKVNFFERTNSEYALANKTIEGDIFEMNADF
jgi:ribonucleotide reductase beta subunit family protein with ferritin-like domain